MPEPVNKTPCCLGLLAHVDAGRGEPQNSPVAPLGEEKEKRGEKTRDVILRIIRENPQILLVRVGPDKGGHWEVL